MALQLTAAEAELKGLRIENGMSNYTGSGYAAGFANEGDGLTFMAEVPASGHYRITVMAAVPKGSGAKWNNLVVDGIKIGDIRTGDSGAFEPCAYPRVYLSEGKHQIGITKGWGGILVDGLGVEPVELADRSRFKVSADLADPEADDCARRLMHYLTDCYGKKILTGQQADGFDSPELDAILRETGKLPAVRGFDFMDYSPSRLAFAEAPSETEAAIEWWRQGGIVTFCWHWNAPKNLINEPPDKMWFSGFYTMATTFDIAKAMDDPASEDYALILRDIDAVAVQLKKLRDSGVPVLWRPLHEASGGWFWWGAYGPEPCIRLWRLLYDRLTRHHGLHHLIWVWNGQSRDWYPGDDVVDIIGEDIYGGPHAYGSQAGRFEDAAACAGTNKLIALTENGTIPDPDELERDQAHWLWFCTWCGTFVWKEENGIRTYSEEHTEKRMLQKVYSHPNAVTRDLLPDLSRYPLPARE